MYAEEPHFIAPGGLLDISSPPHSHIQIQAPHLPAYTLLFPSPPKFLSGSSSPDAPAKTRECPPPTPSFSHICIQPTSRHSGSTQKASPHPTTVPTWVQLPPVSLLPLSALGLFPTRRPTRFYSYQRWPLTLLCSEAPHDQSPHRGPQNSTNAMLVPSAQPAQPARAAPCMVSVKTQNKHACNHYPAHALPRAPR